MSGAIAVGAAVVATALAVDAVATVGVTIGSALAVVGAAGAITGAVGALTGNKTLAMVGGIVGAVGAVGSIAASAGLFSTEVASSFGSATDAASWGGAAAGSQVTDAATWGASAFSGEMVGSQAITLDQLGSMVDVGQGAAGVGGTNVANAFNIPDITTNIPSTATETGGSPMNIVNETGGTPIDTTVKVPNITPTGLSDTSAAAIPLGQPPDVAAPTIDVANAMPTAPGIPAPEAPDATMMATAGADTGDTSKLGRLAGGWYSDPQNLGLQSLSSSTPNAVPGTPGNPLGYNIPGADIYASQGGSPVLGGVLNSGGIAQSTDSWGKSLWDFAKSPLGSGLISAGFKFFAGAFGPESQLVAAQQKQLEAQANANNAAAQASQAQQARIQASYGAPPPKIGPINFTQPSTGGGFFGSV